MEFIQISDEELPENTIPEDTMNMMSRQFNGAAEVGIAPYADEEDTTNTNPNYAVPVSNDSVYQGRLKVKMKCGGIHLHLTRKAL